MKTNIYAFLFSLLTTPVLAQNEFDVRVVHDTRSDMGLSYNFFVGDNVDDFRTTIKGFGSGFLLDAISGRFSHDLVQIGTEEVNLTIGAGVAISKYRFSEPIVFLQDDNSYAYELDSDPTHEYGEGFFSGDKSKLVMASVIFPVNINFDLGKTYLSLGGTLDVYLLAKHKRKFTVDGDRQKVVVRNDVLNDYPFNKTKWGLGAMLMHKETGLSAGVTYMLTPMFEEASLYPEMREVRVSFAYDLSLFDRKRD